MISRIFGYTCLHAHTHYPMPPFLRRYKYTYMEEMLSNIAGARQVFERWMEWEPDEQAWHSYINMELRCKEVDRARGIHGRYVMVHPEVKNWVKFAKFEERQSNSGESQLYCTNSRSVKCRSDWTPDRGTKQALGKLQIFTNHCLKKSLASTGWIE